MAFDVFISHSSKNKKVADAVTSGLESRGIRCWIAPRDIVPGEDYAKQIINGIQNTKVFILIFSKDANHSNFVLKEVERAVSHGIAIIPFRIEDFMPTDSMELYISSAHWLDAITPDMKNHIKKLGDATFAILDKPFVEQVNVKDSTIKGKQINYLYYVLPFLIIMGVFFSYMNLETTTHIVIQNAKVENKVFIKKEILKSLVTNSYYLQYRAKTQGDLLKNGEHAFDLRSIYYHQEVILPYKFKDIIDIEVNNFILYLLDKNKKINKDLGLLSTYDDIEISTLFYEEFIEKSFDLHLSIAKQREELKLFFKGEIVLIGKIIEKLKNIKMVKDKQLIKLQVLNINNIDKEISNTALMENQGKKYKLYRTKQPKRYENFLSVPISNGDVDENSYKKEDYVILKHSKINVLWFNLDDSKIVCSSEKEYYLISLFNRNKDIINGKLLCTKEK